MPSFIENGAGSEIHESPSHSMPLPHGGSDGGAVYAPPPVTMLPPPPPNSSEPTASQPYQAEGASSGGNVIATETPAAEAVMNQSVVNERNDAANNNSNEVIKRKRGRPRKYPPTDGPMSFPTLQSGGTPAEKVVAQGSSGKRGRGRPPGSVNKNKAAVPVSPSVSGSAGVGFTLHVVTVGTGEDVLARIMSFSQLNTQAVCILSANGTISNVTLQQPSSFGGTVTYQGHFELLSLSGSFVLLESGSRRSRTGGLSVSLAGPDGRVLGGGVTGQLIAASPVQVTVGTFMGTSQQVTRQGYEVFTASHQHVSGASVGGSPQSRATLSETSGGPGSPLNHSTGGYNNNNQQTIPNVAWT